MADKPKEPIANLIGGILAGAGVLGAFNAYKQMKDYEQATSASQLIARQIIPTFEKRTAEATKAFEADLTGYGERSVARVQEGLGARGITDTKVSAEATRATRAGLSGAYASARAALSRAKLSATTGLQGAMQKYYMDVADKQYKSQMAQYAGKLGVWGALGGLGTSLLSAPGAFSTTPKKPKDTRTTSTPPKLNLEGF